MPQPRPISPIVSRAVLVALALLLLWNAAGFAAMGARAFLYPYELDYGEGIVWFQMRQLFAGTAFGDIADFPAIVFHYTPLFHFVSGLIERLGIDGLAAGRLVSLLSTVALGLMAGAVAYRFVARENGERRIALAAGAVAALLVPLCYPVQVWAPLMRVDMLAFALTLGGVYCGLRAFERPRFVLAAALLFVLAVYAKQTMVAAPAALFLVLLLHRPRTACAGIAACLLAGGIALGLLVWLTDGGFLRHIFLYNVNRFDAGRLGWIASIAAGHGLLIAAALVGAATHYRSVARLLSRRRDATPADAEAAFLALYCALTTLMLVLVAKSGSSVNYFIEWMAVLCIYAGIASAIAMRRAVTADGEEAAATAAPFGARAVPILLAAQMLMLPAMPYPADRLAQRVEGLDRLAARIAASDRPVIADDMVVLQRAGQPVLWESAIFAELGATGAWDERPFIGMIEDRRFGFFVTAGERGGERFDERYNPAVAAAMARAYPRREEIAGLTLHLPPTPSRHEQAAIGPNGLP